MNLVDLLRASGLKGSSDPVYDGNTSLNVLKTFPAFVANGWGLYKDRAPLTIKSINETIPGLQRIAAFARDCHPSIKPIEEFQGHSCTTANPQRLKGLFEKYGSDKSTNHNYYIAYDRILSQPDQTRKIFEIGLGTNNIDIVSTMGANGRPGASLRAFRDLCPNAEVYGADFDRRVLFTEERIRTFFLDQTEQETFLPLGQAIGGDFDLMIDDGLHAPNANLNSLFFFLPRLKPGGYAVIEDIAPQSECLWKLVAAILTDRFHCDLLQASNELLFIVRRIE